MYDKFGRVLRIDPPPNDVSFFKHHRNVEHRDGSTAFKLAPLKKSIYSLGDLRQLSPPPIIDTWNSSARWRIPPSGPRPSTRSADPSATARAPTRASISSATGTGICCSHWCAASTSSPDSATSTYGSKCRASRPARYPDSSNVYGCMVSSSESAVATSTTSPSSVVAPSSPASSSVSSSCSPSWLCPRRAELSLLALTADA